MELWSAMNNTCWEHNMCKTHLTWTFHFTLARSRECGCPSYLHLLGTLTSVLDPRGSHHPLRKKTLLKQLTITVSRSSCITLSH